MNIVFIESAQNFGGARKAVIVMAEILKDAHRVSIVDVYGSCEPFVKACEDSSIPFTILNKGGNPYFIRSASHLFQRIKNLLGFIPNLRKIARKIDDYVNDNNIDWICLSGFRPLMSFLFRKPNAKVAFFAHGWYLNKDLSRVQKYLLKKYTDKIVCISQATKYALYNDGVSSLHNLPVVHNAINADFMQNLSQEWVGDDNGTLKILLAGGFTKGKGHHIAIDIANELHQRGVNFKLVLAGIIYQGTESQKYFDMIMHLIDERGLSKYVDVLVNKHNILGYMKACDIVIHPSETEGFPLSVLEAMSMGKVVVANAVGGITDMIIDDFTGILVEHNNVKQFADAIVKVSMCEDYYKRLSANAVEIVKDCFCASSIKKELTRVFE